jgi:hypothetical protein
VQHIEDYSAADVERLWRQRISDGDDIARLAQKDVIAKRLDDFVEKNVRQVRPFIVCT